MDDIYASGFYGCLECGFKFSLLGQGNYDISEDFPSCGEALRYLTKDERISYIKALIEDIQSIYG